MDSRNAFLLFLNIIAVVYSSSNPRRFPRRMPCSSLLPAVRSLSILREQVGCEWPLCLRAVFRCSEPAMVKPSLVELPVITADPLSITVQKGSLPFWPFRLP